MPDEHKKRNREKNDTFPEKMFSSKTGQIQELVDTLVSNYRETSRIPLKPGADPTMGGHDLDLYDDWLAKAHTFFREASNQELALTLASEWLLDNYYIIRQALLQIGEDLPARFYFQLPKLRKGSLKGLPRIYGIARTVLAFQNSLLNAIDLQTILIQVQEHVPLTMGELWALPIFLRYCLIETLAQELRFIIRPQIKPDLPVFASPLAGNVDTSQLEREATDDTVASGVVANIILSLRTISEQNWNDYFESVSCVEKTLREDPAGVYPLMDFKTRDLYRKEIETLSFASNREETELAQIVLDLANKNGSSKGKFTRAGSVKNIYERSPDSPNPHVGEYLLGKSRPILEKRIGYHPSVKVSLSRWGMSHASAFYLGTIFFLTLLILNLISFGIGLPESLISSSPLSWTLILVIAVLMFIPILTLTSSMVNWLLSLWIRPRILPKLHFEGEIPARYQTLVTIPALIGSLEDVNSLIHQIELHYLRNPEPGLLYALLTDFHDADSETLPSDNDFVNYAIEAIGKLNAKYSRSIPDSQPTRDNNVVPIKETGADALNDQFQPVIRKNQQLFYLLHRKRLWNQSEGRWMGWERKRGKLHELNRLLRGGKDLSFITIESGSQESKALRTTRFVITLDVDTILPRGAATRLIGTLAHPLNRAIFDEKTHQVVSGYTVLQPRMEIHPRSSNHSWFTRIFAGDTGLDLYTRSVSDAYQDLFGEGSYVGKGIYDVDAFERSAKDRIPENTVLSHDLLEGILGRAGLVTDITMIEDYPSNYYIQIKRQQRWIRGDWQLLLWLIRPGKFKIRFSSIDRWKMLDNLLRAMLAPALMLIFILGTVSLPDLAGFWIALLLFSLGIPLLTSIARSTLQTIGGEKFGAAFHPILWVLARWFLAIAFLPYEAYNAVDAILTTLYRLFISHKHLLQWTTAAQTARLFGLEAHRQTAWLKMIASSLTVILLVGGIQLVHGITRSGIAPSLTLAAPLLVLWMLSPLIATWINHPITHRTIPLNEKQAGLFRQVARRTWGFFERFVGPEDHWLPPDHFQEEPTGITAHQTSPSNIGLLLTSTLAAYDLGYLDQLGLATRLFTTMDTLDQLERFRGHFLNWYDTLTLQPLNPRTISTVDSGNLAACLIITSQACKSIPNRQIFRWDLWQGYLDTLSNLTEILAGMRKTEFELEVEEINRRILTMHDEILAARTDPSTWYALFQKVNGRFWRDLSNRLIRLVKVGRSAFDLKALQKLQEVSAQVERHHQAIQRTLSELVPWVQLLEQVPKIFGEVRFIKVLNKLRTQLPYNPHLYKIKDFVKFGLLITAELRVLITEGHSRPVKGPGPAADALDWLKAMDKALAEAELNSNTLMNRFSQISMRAKQVIEEMDFNFLYNPQRRVFHNSYNLDNGQLDNSFYDLLASEARIASIIAIAKGEVPQSHWLQLSRPLTLVEGDYVLLSWSATMFEYLMPPLFLRSYPGTLLAESVHGAVKHQIAYGKARGGPWGISECGFYLFDANRNYQYRAFGVPGLGFKRGLGDDLVIAPYASIMAIGFEPSAVAQNLINLMKLDCFGLYGLYESIDFTANRMLVGDTSKVVQEYMTHHQGMILMALVNYFHNNIMVHRMHSDPRIQSIELLLQEQIPQSVPLQNPFAEDVKGIQRLTAGSIEIKPWSVPVHTAIPQVNLLSNGNYGVLLSNMGGGYSTFRGTDLTRWQADGVLDPWGTWIYIQDLNLKRARTTPGVGLWSAGYQPIPANGQEIQVTFFAHMAVFRRTENGITSTMEVTVCPDDPVEIRRIHLQNTKNQPRHLRLTSYGEVILAQHAADDRHPAFNKMFIESEFVPELALQIFSRRPRTGEEPPLYMGHMLVVKSKGEFGVGKPPVRHEADRDLFIGRGRNFRNPAALDTERYLTGTSGATLDPIFALGQDVELDSQESVEMAFLTFVGDSRETVLALARRFGSWSLIERSFHLANISAQSWLGKQGYDSQLFKNSLEILSALIYPFKNVRTSPETIASNRLDQTGLWRFGISGDYPILLVELEDPQQVDLIRQVLQVYEFLRSRRFVVDVVILNYQKTDYGAELNGMLYRLVSRLNCEQWLNKRGGIYILHADQITTDERTLLQTAGRYVLAGSRGALNDQMPEFPTQVHHLPEFIPTSSAERGALDLEEDPLPLTEALQFNNGYGGFSKDGKEYIIELPPGRMTPAPWVNIVGYPNFGFLVSETGSQCTWAINSGENRLTGWSNDPVCDPTGEVLYLRDEETGEVWTPTPLPAGEHQTYRIRHGAGYTIFENNSHGLCQHLTIFASPEDPVKIIHLRIKNTWEHTRRITATQYIEWVLGTTRAGSAPYIIPEYDAAEACLMATNPSNTEFGERTAFLIASKTIHGLTGDRVEFLGRGGTPAFPIALHRLGLETRLSPGEDPCAVLQLHLDLLPDAEEEIYFVLGQGQSKEHALGLAKKYHESAYVGAALERTRAFWDHLLGRVQAHTPEPATDILLNRWLLYQTLSCRIWGRSAFYQPGGAFGFRDQLQDVLALLPIDPSISRGQIMNAAQHQFIEGDVMHWWHPPSGWGIRTRVSDDMLWLPYITSLYIETTGDINILDEKTPFLEAPVLNKDEIERYNKYPQTRKAYPLIEHCHRAIRKGATKGPNGMPLIGSGDWNDGLNRVGLEGKGESVWLGWFLCDVLKRFSNICDLRGETDKAKVYRSQAKEYAAAIERSAWDGAWYRRAYFDDGTPLGSNQEPECQIDSIAQSWSVISGAGNPIRSRQSMKSSLERLVLPEDRLVLLFTPPFDKSVQDPGYIKGYLPGTRENGGQYTHAAIWSAWAYALFGDGKQAGDLFNLLNPIFLSDSPEKINEYRVEPYVMCADIYSKPPYMHRGGWTWYSGSAAWMYQLGLTTLLGFKKVSNSLHIDPVIPPLWDGFDIHYQYGKSGYQIKVKNPKHISHGVDTIKKDGKNLNGKAIPLIDDGHNHDVEVIMGD
jgi:cyclic beta-1,2-glucan synthetase